MVKNKESMNNISNNEENVPALVGFILSFFSFLAIIGFILSALGYVTSDKYSKDRKKMSIAGMAISFIVIILSFIIAFSDSGDDSISTSNNYNTTYEETEPEEEAEPIEVVDFKTMTRADIDSWCKEKNISCSFDNDYSDTVEKGGFISQSVEAGHKVYEDDEIKIVYSLGKKPTISQTNALNSALSYLRYSAFSYTGLIEQLEYEKYSHEDAVYAVDNCGADWNEQAKKSAASYLKYSSFSRDGLIDQLEYEGFTYDQAVYGVTQNGL